MKISQRKERQIKRGSVGGGGEGRSKEFGSRENSMHLLLLLRKPVFWTCMNIMHFYEHSFFFTLGLLSDK